MARVLLLLPTSTYRTEAFVRAAGRLGVDVTAASERPSALARLNPAALLTLDFHNPQRAARQAVQFAAEWPVDAVVPVDSQVLVAAAAIARALGLPHNPVESAEAAQNKFLMRRLFQQAGVPTPSFRLCSFDEDRGALARQVGYPCVVKPLHLAASQGVIRANNPAELLQAVARLQAIVDQSTDHSTGCGQAERSGRATPQPDAEANSRFLVERYVSGPEVALEGMLCRGRLQTLALFDKPDPLEGPYFEETIYVTPSRLPAEVQQTLAQCAGQAAQALGLQRGPIHAELRLAAEGPVVIEVNPRSIGGLCSRVLRFGTGWSLEELILRQALDEQFQPPPRQPEPAGVMMIPVPQAGRLSEVRGLDQARQVAGIDDVVISAHLGQHLMPPPDGGQYPGFLFARGQSPQAVETALRQAHQRLHFVME